MPSISKELLSQYLDLKDEIKSIKANIAHLEKSKIIEHDSVKASSVEFPYTSHAVGVAGVNTPREMHRIRQIKRRQRMLEDRVDQSLEQLNIIQEFVNSIPDALTRRVFTYRYIEGIRSWQRIAFMIGRHDESYPRQHVHDKYLKIYFQKTEKTDLSDV